MCVITASKFLYGQTPGACNLLTQPIPRIIHFVWIDVNFKLNLPIPNEMQHNINQWRHLNPSWTIIVWTTSRTLSEFPEFVDEIRHYHVAAWQSDLIRYKILIEHGGLYLDTDITPLRRLPPEIVAKPFAVCEKPLAFEPGPCTQVCNAVIGVPARLPVMVRVLDTALWRSRVFASFFPSVYSIHLSGPPVLSLYVLDDSNCFETLATHTFFPCWFKDRSQCVKSTFESNPEIFAMHTWNHSWKMSTISVFD